MPRAPPNCGAQPWQRLCESDELPGHRVRDGRRHIGTHLRAILLGEQMLAIQPRLRLILTTGYSVSLNAERARQMGFHEFLIKPYDMRSLAEALRHAFDQPAPAPHPAGG